MEKKLSSFQLTAWFIYISSLWFHIMALSFKFVLIGKKI